MRGNWKWLLLVLAVLAGFTLGAIIFFGLTFGGVAGRTMMGGRGYYAPFRGPMMGDFGFGRLLGGLLLFLLGLAILVLAAFGLAHLLEGKRGPMHMHPHDHTHETVGPYVPGARVNEPAAPRAPVVNPNESVAPQAPAVITPNSPEWEAANNMTPCPNCGRPVQADWVACPHCGTTLTPSAGVPPVV